MKIHVLSDVHLEFQRWRRQWDISTIDCDVHVLAGDIGIGLTGLEFALQRLTKPTVYVVGNHEFYCRRTVSAWWRDARRKAADTHVHLLENESVTVSGVRFLGTTLWVDFALFGMDQQNDVGAQCAARINDFAQIYLSRTSATKSAIDPIESRGHIGRRLTWRMVAEWHQIAREFLERELPKTGDWDRTVVVTHHAPSPSGVRNPKIPSYLDAAYAVRLDHLIPLADAWIHGHVHRATDYEGKMGGACSPQRARVLGQGLECSGWISVESSDLIVTSDLRDLSLATLISRPGFSLYTTTARQIEDRRSSIDLTASRHVRALIDDWHMISLHRHDIDEVRIHLVGQVRGTRRIRITTPLREIDQAADLVITQNSVYSLGSRGAGEPSHRHLLAIIHVFHAWGLGLALGMPRIFAGSDD